MKFTNSEIRAHLIFKWKKKIYYGTCKLIHILGCYGCKDYKICEKYRMKKMISGN